MASSSGVSKVVDLYAQLKERDAARNNSYDEVLKFYAGSTLNETKKQGFMSGITKALSSVFTPKEGEEDTQLTTPINLIKPAIENKVAFLALPPTVRVIEPPPQLAPGASPGAGGASPSGPPSLTAVPGGLGAGPSAAGPEALPAGPTGPAPPGPLPPGIAASTGDTGQDWGIDFADRLEQAISSLLAFSNMPKRCRDIAWSMCAMDGAVIGVWPDFRHECPRIFTRTPQDFYPVSYDPDGLELTKALWMEVMNGNDIEARWGNNKYIGRNDVEVIQCIDEENFYTVLDGTEWAHPPVKNLMGIVPIVCVGALGLPGMIFGGTDIKDAIPVAKQINYHMSLIDEMASAMVKPTIVIKDPLNVPPDLAIGKGGVATMGPNGSAEVLGPISLPSAFWQLSNTLQTWFDLIADNPAVLRSEGGGSIITGKGFNAQLGPIAARMQTRLDIVMSAWKQVIKYMLMMWKDFPGVTGTLKLSGSKNKVTYYIEATPDDFVVNGQMWTEIEVYLAAQSYMDRQGNAVELMQLYQNELIDWDSVADDLPQITNKKRTRAAIDRDRKWKAEGLAMSQQVAQSGMTANTPLSDQQQTNYGLERGFMGETGPAPGPQGEAPPATAGANGSTDPTNQLISILEEFFRGIPKLKGSVWFGGDPFLAPEKFASDNWSVTVWITDPQDQGTITRAAEKVPEVYGHLQFKQGAPSPDEQTKQVAGGDTSGTPGGAPPSGVPTGAGEGATPPAGMPPELAAMMGGV